MPCCQGCLLLLLMVCGSLHCGQTEGVRPPTVPKPITGRPSCLQPIKAMRCIRDTRSKFVAGVSTSYGEGFGFRDVCNDGGVNTYYTMGTQGEGVERFDMSAPTEPGFPKDADGNPDFRYFYPYEGPITQMIVLQAANPWGPKFGRIPAIIFGYLATSENVTSLQFAVCGNADYAMSYLNPGKYPLPPTMVTLDASYTNPLSEELPARYLGSFSGKCGLMGRWNNYLWGDPNKISKYHLKRTTQACFAAPAKFIPNPGTPPRPLAKRVWSSLEKNTFDYIPCAYNKQTAKGAGASYSCVANGYAVATGRYGVINFDDKTGGTIGWVRDEKTGSVSIADAPELYSGKGEGASQAAPAPAPAPDQ